MTRISFAVRRDEVKRIEVQDRYEDSMRGNKLASVLVKPLEHNSKILKGFLRNQSNYVAV
jgi:hypothetical protein